MLVEFKLELYLKDGDAAKQITTIFEEREDFDVHISNRLSPNPNHINLSIEGDWLDKKCLYYHINKERCKKRLQFILKEYKKDLIKAYIKIGGSNEEPVFGQAELILG